MSGSVSFCEEERHLPVSGFILVPGAGEGSGQEVTLQSGYQPARWLQHVQVTAGGGEYADLRHKLLNMIFPPLY